jgi:hypothetical protein
MTIDVTESLALDCAGARANWREQTTEQAISITQQAIDGLATWSLAAAA